jgi:hypothetical protein
MSDSGVSGEGGESKTWAGRWVCVASVGGGFFDDTFGKFFENMFVAEAFISMVKNHKQY